MGEDREFSELRVVDVHGKEVELSGFGSARLRAVPRGPPVVRHEPVALVYARFRLVPAPLDGSRDPSSP